MQTGDLRARMTFQARVEVDNGRGSALADFADQFTVWAGLTPIRGGETIIAQRLAGTQPFFITVRWSADTDKIRADWRAKIGTTRLFNITSAVDRDGRKQWVDLTATEGAPA